MVTSAPQLTNGRKRLWHPVDVRKQRLTWQSLISKCFLSHRSNWTLRIRFKCHATPEKPQFSRSRKQQSCSSWPSFFPPQCCLHYHATALPIKNSHFVLLYLHLWHFKENKPQGCSFSVEEEWSHSPPTIWLTSLQHLVPSSGQNTERLWIIQC